MPTCNTPPFSDLPTAWDAWVLQQAQTASAEDAWLWQQTAYTGTTRRHWLAQLPVRATDHLAELGCGLGLGVCELAAHFGAQVTGYDCLPDRIRQAEGVQARWRATPWAARVAFHTADITQTVPSTRYDGLVVRFVLQHLPDPLAALTQWRQWVRPGGWIAIEDADDGWTIEYPPPPAAWQRVLEAFRQDQARVGGNRTIGRQLPLLVLEAGWALTRCAVVPQTSVLPLDWASATVQFEWNRVHNARDRMLAHGLLTPADWAAGVTALQQSLPHTSFLSNATVQLQGQAVDSNAAVPPGVSADPTRSPRPPEAY